MMDQAVCCYRHPDRETGIRCVRCERPICPECMISASVGFQCPECVQEGHRGTPQPRTVGGGSLVADPRLVTKILIGLNLAIFIVVQVGGDQVVRALDLYGVCNPYSGQCSGVAAGPGQWYRLLTTVFLHQQVMHLAFNMLALWWVGGPLESLLGRARYLALYLLSGLGGSALVILLSPGTATLGASGAIFGLFGATAVCVRRMRYDMKPVLILLGLNLFFTFTWSGISWQGHVGGLVTGTLAAIGIAYAPRERRALVQWGTCALVLVAVAVLTWVGITRITG
jgi:membrane associated rhomboid family serine protease